MTTPASHFSGRPLRCSKCLDVAERTVEGLCPDCHEESRRCDRCGRPNVSTKPFRKPDWDEVGLEGSSRFCFRCRDRAKAEGFVEAIA